MNIGILTFYYNANFGANLQAVSTCRYLEKVGHTPYFIIYKSEKGKDKLNKLEHDIQFQAHIAFLNENIKNQSAICSTTDEVDKVLEDWHIDSIIIGSDAVLQHHPLISRIKKGKRKPIVVSTPLPEQSFPNFFWGVGIKENIPCAMMSVSSQNSEYMYFAPWKKKKMKAALSRMKYISVRDTWTRDMVKTITGEEVSITPDPVFAFNYNALELVCSKEDIIKKYHLPEKYVLVSLKKQSLPIDMLKELKERFAEVGLTCVALTMPGGIKFKHNFEYEVAPPLPPNDWFSLIKHASGYVGSNMHPIVVSLHNATPCVSIDNWGRTDFWGKKINDGSSKVEHIMNEFRVGKWHHMITDSICHISAKEVVDLIVSFPVDAVAAHAKKYYAKYEEMMTRIISSINNDE